MPRHVRRYFRTSIASPGKWNEKPYPSTLLLTTLCGTLAADTVSLFVVSANANDYASEALLFGNVWLRVVYRIFMALDEPA